ncbi:hypothetical protein P5V30_20535 [Mycobacteroides abscessus subsp. abscessus]|uniref:hypothetical protein n=1 Tax=Mycobacteroides abscessus TaxID=36809 RepID=UPI00138FDC15|nr:hypothetical protein [Mycobacteroides abscessus]MDO2986921.1 hypothetical protein [Mycobacteroides abscessus subsp. abscessus]
MTSSIRSSIQPTNIDAYIPKKQDTAVDEDAENTGSFVTSLRKCRDDLQAAAKEVHAAAVGAPADARVSVDRMVAHE